MKRAAYASNEMPYVAMILVKPGYDHSVLQTLRLDHNHGLEYVDDGRRGVWQLLAPKQTLWLQLQDVLRLTISVIQKYSGGFMSHLELQPPRRFPTDFGFTRQYERREDAKKAIFDARGSFDLLFAYVAFHMCGSGSMISPSPYVKTVGWGEWPGWALEALNKKIMPAAWINMLLYSEISDFTLKRVGCYIIPGSCEWLELVPIFLRRKIPIALVYPMGPQDLKACDLSRLRNQDLEKIFGLSENERILYEWSVKANPTVYPVYPTPASLVAARAAVGAPQSSFATSSSTKASPTTGWEGAHDNWPRERRTAP